MPGDDAEAPQTGIGRRRGSNVNLNMLASSTISTAASTGFIF